MDRATLALNDAIPLIKEAEEAVNCLNKPAIDELKSFGSPSAAVLLVVKAVLILYKNEKRNYAWDNGKKMMKDPNAFLAALKGFNKEDIPDWVIKEMDAILEDPSYNEATMKKGSSAAASLCVWSIAVMKYNKVYKFVKPLEDEAKAAKELADTKLAELKVVQDNVAAILAKVAELQAQLEEANAKKKKVEDQAEALNNKLDLANRLVGGLADENKRWKELVKTLGGDALKMIGNCVISAAFVSYIGPFSQEFRDDLWREQWLADIVKNKIPFTAGIDPLEILSNASIQAGWKTEGLPADRISMENGSIVTNCARFPLMIDPQLQGQNWIQGREGGGMTKIQLSQKGWNKRVEQAVSNGNVLMIENLSDKIDAVLDPLLSKNYTKKGKAQFVKLGNEDVEVHPQFRLYLQTKMQNPHYIPEVAAQCTIINFIVTEAGLEDQLLAEVVRIEKPDLEQQRDELVQQQNQSEITLAKLSDQLLQNLSDADPATILENFELIEGLETTKKTSTEIELQQKEAVITGKVIAESREVYRPVAAEGAMLYFLLIKMYIVDPMYQYSLESFGQFFYKAIGETLVEEDDKVKVQNLVSNIRMGVFRWVARGLFERHKQIFLSLLTFRLMQKGLLEEEYNAIQMNFLVNCPLDTSVPRPAVLKDWLPEVAWYSVQSLIKIEPFEQFATHLEKEMPRRFNEWYNELAPEACKLPGDWKILDKAPFQKMLVTRCLRPDRVTAQLSTFIRKTLPKGDSFVDCDNTSSADDILQTSFVDSSP
jgi:dynein heavy chain